MTISTKRKRPQQLKKPMPVGRVCKARGCTTILSRYNRHPQEICGSCYEATPLSGRLYTVKDWV